MLTITVIVTLAITYVLGPCMGDPWYHHSWMLPLCLPEYVMYLRRIEDVPANAGNTGSVPGWGRSHVLWNKGSRTHEQQLPSPCAVTTDAPVPKARAL